MEQLEGQITSACVANGTTVFSAALLSVIMQLLNPGYQ
jgi:hypothetical protein